MNWKDTQVAILCGGRGTRLKPHTKSAPKALVHIAGRPIIDHVLDFYRSKGLSRFILCVGHKAEMIKEHYAKAPPGTELAFSNEGENASMLHRVFALRDEIDQRVIVSYCDTFIDLDLERLLATHVEQRAEATIVTAQIRNPFGLVECDNEGWVSSFAEKPLQNYYIGSFILERCALADVTREMIRKPNGQGLVEDLFGRLIERRRLALFVHSGLQITFNTESERREAEVSLGQFYTYSDQS